MDALAWKRTMSSGFAKQTEERCCMTEAEGLAPALLVVTGSSRLLSVVWQMHDGAF